MQGKTNSKQTKLKQNANATRTKVNANHPHLV